jgi:hypothetical protein
MSRRKELVDELAPYRSSVREHPWAEWAGLESETQRMPGAQSRWNAGKNLSWEPLRPELVCEVAYDHMQATGSGMRRSSSAGAGARSRDRAPTLSSSRP